MDILEHDAIMAQKVASEMAPFELRMEKKRRLRAFHSVRAWTLMAGKDIDMSDDDLYQKFIDCEINIDELGKLIKERLAQEYKDLLDEKSINNCKAPC